MLRKYGALVGVVVAAVFAVAAPRAGAVASPMLPDLRQAPVGCPGGRDGDLAHCSDWDVCMVAEISAPRGECLETGPAKAVRIRFTSSVDNVGDGPLLLFGRRDSTDEPTMRVRQAFQSGVDGPIPDGFATAQRGTTAFAYYEPTRSHEHWHLMGFERFQLRTPAGEPLSTDRKNGFCLGDRYPTHDVGRLTYTPQVGTAAGRVAEMLEDNTCAHGGPDALDVVEGISVGSGDAYRYDVDFQWLDITYVPSGVYDLVHTANPDRSLLEKDYSNNSSSVSLSVEWPDEDGPMMTPPKVEFLRSCPGEGRCS
ncbi:lysyl oxidase family protein [Umezawaea sp. Da 62-37]|uniref:lysyl oxidase family protein n=1 Tax=Umezawaea sp. Da 62-37 TaxID=3075927 RepID=UPI0028F720B7|nr:lysyl oxidase family protein [Umezawaea sp. Da 62-37]WNV88534.1 lysyl oxidase family protein [Umezawaea sp. Da 62-37]